MKIVISNTKTFYKIFSLLSNFGETITIKCNDGIQIFSMACQTSIFVLQIDIGFFETFECTQHVEFTVHGKTFISLLKSFQNASAITLSYHQDTVVFEVLNNSQHINLELKTFHIDEDELEIPEVSFSNEYNIVGALLKDWKKDILPYCGNAINFICNGDAFTLETHSDVGTLKVQETIGEKITTIKHETDMNMTLSASSVSIITTLNEIANNITFCYGDNIPIGAKCNIPHAQISMWFAPLICDMEED